MVWLLATKKRAPKAVAMGAQEGSNIAMRIYT